MRDIRQFDLNLLVIFEALVTESHVSRAANKVFLSQSAMSHALKRLREQLNDPILVRDEKGLRPTERAIAILPKVQKALNIIQQSLDNESFDPKTSQRCFRIACTDYFETVVFPNWFSQLLQEAPNVRIEIEMIAEENISSQLEEGFIDIVAGLEQEQLGKTHLLSEAWLTEHYICLTGEHNKTLPSQLSMKQYLELNHVMLADVTGEKNSRLDSWLQQQGIQRSGIATSYNHLSAARIVTQTNSVMTLPYRMAYLFTQMLPLRMLRPPMGFPHINMTLIQHPAYQNDSAVNWLKNHLQQYSQTLFVKGL